MKQFKKQLIFLSTNRADYYLQKYIISRINKKFFKTKFFFVGDLDQYKAIKIEKTNFDYKLTYNIKENNNATNLKISKIVKKFPVKIINDNKNIFVLLGDRFETLSLALLAYNKKIPIIHIHGGEKTIESLDQGYRDMISKISTLHLVSAEQNKKNLLNMNIEKSRIKNIGSIGASLLKSSISNIKKNNINFKFRNKNFFIVTYHPNQLDPIKIKNEINILLSSLSKFKNDIFVFTKPNGEYGSATIVNSIKSELKKNKNFFYLKNIGSYFSSYLFFCSGVIGNSSSGILEAPIFNKPSINIGNRQKCRLSDLSVLNCDFNEKQIVKCFNKIKTKKFLNKIKKINSIYFKKNTIEMIEKAIIKFFQ